VSSIRSIIKELSHYPVATVYEAVGKIGDVSNRIRPLVPGMRIAGTALTVKAFPGDMQAVFHAIEGAEAGDVLVVDGGDAERGTIFGGTGMAAAIKKGIAGFVTNGAVRDYAEIAEAKFPTFCAGVSLRGTVRGHQGWINIPIALGDVPINPGDIVLGDEDGVMIIPKENAARALELTISQHDRETKRDDRLRAGESVVAVLNLPPRT
jgi:4-hydroxy-4-methyl-2-oxoglutarate aldolase